MPIKVRLEAIDVRSPALAAWVLFAPFPSPSSPSISHGVARNLSQFAKSSSPDLIPTQRFDLSLPPIFLPGFPLCFEGDSVYVLGSVGRKLHADVICFGLRSRFVACLVLGDFE